MTGDTNFTVSRALLDELRRLFPDRAPDLSKTEKQIWYAAGQVSVVRWLSLQYESQTKKDLS